VEGFAVKAKRLISGGMVSGRIRPRRERAAAMRLRAISAAALPREENLEWVA
jgi:hypothetical protein